MTAIYDQDGIRFLYPENWTLSEERPGQQQEAVQIAVQSPQSGYWSLHVYAAGVNPEQLVEESLRIMKLEYEELECEPVSEQIDLVQLVGYDLDFYCLDFVVSARLRGFSADEKSFLVLYQAESREFEQIAPVFQAITVSLVRGEHPSVD